MVALLGLIPAAQLSAFDGDNAGQDDGGPDDGGPDDEGPDDGGPDEGGENYGEEEDDDRGEYQDDDGHNGGHVHGHETGRHHHAHERLGWGPGYGFGPAFGFGAFGYAPPYYRPPYFAYSPLVVQRGPPPVYIQRKDTGDSVSEPRANYWHYCRTPEAEGYYPEVQECPDGWMQVAPQAQSADQE